jgi:phage-related baseplate assembly protein
MPASKVTPVFTPPSTDTPPSTGGAVGVPPGEPNYGLQWVPDIDFAVKDPTIIQNEVILDYQATFLILTGIAKTLAPGDPVRLHLLVVCDWLSQQRVIIDFTGKNNLLKYAHDDYLDNLAALHGDRALRLQASPAQTTLRFTLAAPLAFSATIPSGTLCQAPNSVVFQTLVDGVLPAGTLTVDVPAQAVVAGLVGNGFAPGQISGVINWNQPYAISVTNTVVTAGGGDPEPDDQYRYRVWLAIESYSTCGPHDAYEFWALSADPSIIQAVVYSAPAIAGEVWIYPLCTGGTLPTTAILQAVLNSCSANTRRPVSDYVSVFAPTVVPFTVNVDYWILTENQVLLSTIQANVQKAVLDWIQWQRSSVSRDINGDELIKRCLEAGAKRIIINTPNPSFQTMAYNQLAVCDPKGPLADQSFTDGVNTASTAIWQSASANFVSTDVGLSITGTNIQVNTTILSVQSATQITLSQNTVAGTGSGLAFTIHARISPIIVNYKGLEDA